MLIVFALVRVGIRLNLEIDFVDTTTQFEERNKNQDDKKLLCHVKFIARLGSLRIHKKISFSDVRCRVR